MSFENLFSRIDEVQNEVNYWFVRTDKGRNFDYFREKGVIAIGWNEITLLDLKTSNEGKIREKISKIEDLDVSDSRNKSKVTAIYNKLLRFMNFKKGDIIVMPSANSSLLAFGTINDDEIYTETNDIKDVDYYKRRKVKWFTVRDFHKLDPNFYQLIQTQHVISNINKYDKFIDRVIHSVYKKNGYAHLVLDAKKKDNIDVISLLSLINSLQELIEEVNVNFSFEEDTEKNAIRLNLQSPGTIELILKNGKSLLMLSAILHFMSCGNVDGLNLPDEDERKLFEFIEIKEQRIDTIRKGLEDLEIDIDKYNSIY